MQQRLTTRTAIRDRVARNRRVRCGKSTGGQVRDLSRVTEPDDPRAHYVRYLAGNKDHWDWTGRWTCVTFDISYGVLGAGSPTSRESELVLKSVKKRMTGFKTFNHAFIQTSWPCSVNQMARFTIYLIEEINLSICRGKFLFLHCYVMLKQDRNRIFM